MTSTPDYALADRIAREQITSLLDETLFVEAGAGTGKTAALVQRYLTLVLAGRSVERIVAITFTDKAAAELRDRVRQGLEARLQEDCTAQEKQRIETALAGLDRAQISTIHAFGQMLLRSLAVRAGIDPAFEVEDGVAAERRFEERWRRYLDGLGNDRGAIEVVGRVLDLGLNPGNLQAMAHALWSRSELAEKLRAEPLTAPEAEWPDLHVLREELVSLPRAGVPDDDRLLIQLRQAQDMLDDLLATPREERDARLVGLMSRKPQMTNGRQPNWGGKDAIENARAAGKQVVGSLQTTLDALRSKALADVLPLVVTFVIEETRARAREGRLVFDDLILRVRDALINDRDARIDLRQRFDTILIDEFQDTDPLQADIALAFARNPETGQPEPGRLFVVGDPKQSIYRFRGADMAFYAGAKQALEDAGARQVDLSLNRRSQPGVLDWVNAVFQGVIGLGLNEEVQPPYKAIGPYRQDDLDGPSVSWLGEPLNLPASQIRQIEARHIAAHCRDAVAQSWQVAGRDGSSRPARYGDIAILLPVRTSLPPLERALGAEGIPYRVEGGSLVYATQEVRDVINCLTAIDDPGDDVAVVASLRSPAYACSDVEIALYRRGGGSFNYLSPQLDALTGRVAEALRDLRDWHGERRMRPLASLVERFIGARRLVEIGLVDSGTRNAFRRARFLVEQARAFESSGPESLRALVEWLERRATDAIYDYEGAGLDDDEDAVRVLTIHAAKGLEFPIVFLMGLGTPPRSDTPVFGHDRDDDRIAVRIGAVSRNAVFQLGPVEDVNLHERLHADAERDRLLYVAATRARDHLVVSLFHKEGTSTCAAAKLILHGAREQAEPLLPVDMALAAPANPFATLVVEASDLDEEAFESGRTALIAASMRRRYTSATALGRHGAEPDQEEREDETEPWSRGRAGTHLGRAVHAALQSLPWEASDAAVEAVARAQTVAEAVPQRAEEAAKLIHVALATDAARRARVANRALREVPFALGHEGVILEGYVDLLIESDDGIEIVDWKTDHIPPSAVEARLQEYELQAGVYVLGIEAATGRSVRRVTYVFVAANREVEMRDPALLRDAALRRLAAEATPA